MLTDWFIIIIIIIIIIIAPVYTHFLNMNDSILIDNNTVMLLS